MKRLSNNRIDIDLEDDEDGTVTVGINSDEEFPTYYVEHENDAGDLRTIVLSAEQWRFVYSALEDIINSVETKPLPNIKNKKTK